MQEVQHFEHTHSRTHKFKIGQKEKKRGASKTEI